ncbi:MAG: hypothetical protein NTX17_04155 [Candidatus Eisenbacteria bacterium]|nr:hypothetical protein [Candidatus Eisenbacteria bacterium]
MGRERSALLLLLVVSLVLLAIPTSSSAYLETIWLRGTGVELIQGSGTIRLAGMGNLTVAIEDENNQVDLYDFTGNVAALALDKNTSNVDSWASYGKWADEKDDFRWQDIDIVQSGALVVLRGKGDYAGGVTISTRRLDLNRVDDRNLRELLKVSFPKSETARPETSLVDTEITSDLVEGYYTHKVFGRAFLGVHGWGMFDAEKKPVRLHYDLTDDVDDFGGGLGLVVLPTKWMQIGGTVDLNSQLVEATSVDAFHQDTYTQKRGILTVSSHALLEFMGKLRGVMNYKHSSFDSDETLDLHWSELYVLNPQLETDVRMKLKVASESHVSDFFATRWIVSGLGLPLTVSGYFDMLNEEFWLHNEPNVILWVDEYDEALNEWNLRGGASYKIGEKGQAGMEVRLNRGKLENRLPIEEGYRNFRTLDVRGGGEYRLLRWLALRAGYSRAKEERSIGVPEYDFNSNTLSVGAGCFLRKDSLSLDAAFVNKVTRPEQDIGDGRETRDQSFTLYGRFLF